MMKTLTGVLALVTLLLLSGTAVQAGEVVVLPFHTTLTVVEDCESSTNPSALCLGFQDWLASCQAQGYDWGFQDVRKGEATLIGRVTSFEQGCLDFQTGPGGIVRSYVQLTMTGLHGNTLTIYAAGMFDFALANAPGAGSFSITGGTGRFAGARGSGTLGAITVEGNPGAVVYQNGWLRLAPRVERTASHLLGGHVAQLGRSFEALDPLEWLARMTHRQDLPDRSARLHSLRPEDADHRPPGRPEAGTRTPSPAGPGQRVGREAATGADGRAGARRAPQRSTPTTICVNECAGNAKWSLVPLAGTASVFGG
jgi:hypothetical protein